MRLGAMLLLQIALLAPFGAQAQDKPDFGRLRSERQQVVADLDVSKTKLRDAEGEARRVVATVKDIESFIDRNKAASDAAKKRLDSLKASRATQQAIDNKEREISDLEGSTARARQDLEDKGTATRTIDEMRANIRVGERKLADIETQINELLSRDNMAQTFKTQISKYFAWVVALMIVGFFGIAFYDPVVRNNIFSGQSGMQFVTLFLIVISIILFGITGILQDKELAALLGGLSGYILGKYGNDTGSGDRNGSRSGSPQRA